MDVIDLGERSFNTFGLVVFRNVFVQCRTANGLALSSPNNAKQNDNMWARKSFQVFRAYDTGQSHVLDSWRLKGCGSAASPTQTSMGFRGATIWSIPHGVNVGQNQLIMRNITYDDGPPDPVKLFSFDVGQRDTYGAYFATLLDADGSLTGRRVGDTCRPTLVGSANTIRAITGSYQITPSNLWYKLSGLDDGGARGSASSNDTRCSLFSASEYPMWVCDRGSINVGSIMVMPNNRAETSARTKEVWGRVAHFGDDLLVDGPYAHPEIELITRVRMHRCF